MPQTPIDRTRRPAPAPAWSPEELAEVAPLLEEIDAFAPTRPRPPVDGELKLALSDALPLLPELAASTRQLLTRQLMQRLGFDERRLAKWRLEHKLIQALVFDRYAPGSLPVTCGLDRIAWRTGLGNLRVSLRDRFPSGFVVKTGLGDSSGDNCDFRTEAALSWIENGGRGNPAPSLLTSEEFVVQERVAIRREYRVHTVEDRVIEDLTVRRHHGTVGPGERSAPNRRVQSILDMLPAGLTAGAILAWDVAVTEDGSVSVIEINIGGMHTVYNPGFHASGYYHHKHYGCVYTARLLLFIERTYKCSISVLADAPDRAEERSFYEEVNDWKSRF
ncbi:MAG: hypothetical protein ABSF64_22055 [Bryobacteraceae bacterium]|jgi:hypothetical protein